MRVPLSRRIVRVVGRLGELHLVHFHASDCRGGEFLSFFLQPRVGDAGGHALRPLLRLLFLALSRCWCRGRVVGRAHVGRTGLPRLAGWTRDACRAVVVIVRAALRLLGVLANFELLVADDHDAGAA